MNSDKTIVAIAATTVVVLAVPLFLHFRTLPPAQLTAAEKELTTFTNQPVTMAAAPQPLTFSGKSCPVPPPPKPPPAIVKAPLLSGFADKIRSTFAARTLSSKPVVSMIYYAGYTRMAIIDRHVVNEGAELDGGVVVTIEKTRVLWRKAGKDLWLTTE